MTGSVHEAARVIRSRQSFVLASHARPDGDAIGSTLALAFALRSLGKSVRIVSHDVVPAPYRVFPGTGDIEIVSQVDGEADAAVILECPDLARTDLGGLDKYFLVNIDHHLGNKLYGAVNWFDETAAACGEMVADLIDELGVPWTKDIGMHLFLAIATDTGGFHHGHISARTFGICRRIAETGLEPAMLSRLIFDGYGVGRVKLMGALLNRMELFADERIAMLSFDDELLSACGATVDDTEGLVNLPLGAKDVLASVLFKRQTDGRYRLSLRSKGAVDVRRVAEIWGGGGHTNAAGATVPGPFEKAKAAVVEALTKAIQS